MVPLATIGAVSLSVLLDDETSRHPFEEEEAGSRVGKGVGCDRQPVNCFSVSLTCLSL